MTTGQTEPTSGIQACYITLIPHGPGDSFRQVTIEPGIILDIGADGRAIGIETLGRPIDLDAVLSVVASCRWPVRPEGGPDAR